MTSTSSAPRQLSDQNSQGTILGKSTADLIGFYGLTTGVAQPTGPTAIVTTTLVTTAATSTTPFGYATAAQADALVTIVNDLRTQVNTMRTCLRTLGLVG
jgi:hypothetical protein